MEGAYECVAQLTNTKGAKGFFGGGGELSRIGITGWTDGGCFVSRKACTSY